VCRVYHGDDETLRHRRRHQDVAMCNKKMRSVELLYMHIRGTAHTFSVLLVPRVQSHSMAWQGAWDPSNQLRGSSFTEIDSSCTHPCVYKCISGFFSLARPAISF
jgi:hypothetical protein